jgi:diguanylate cyclase (GGDEF)-like protein
MSYASAADVADKRSMEANRHQPARALQPGRVRPISESLRTLLAATAGDVCELLHAPFCAISQVDGDDAVVVAVQGARSHRAQPPGTRWHVSGVPPARQAIATSRTVVLTHRDDPRLTDEQRSALTGEPDLVSLAFIPLQSDQRIAGLLVVGDTRPHDLATAAPQITVVARLIALALLQDRRLEESARAVADLALVLDADLEAQSRTSAPEQVLRVLARRFAELCHAPMVDIFTIEGETLRALVSWQHGGFRSDYEGAVENLADWPLTRAAAASGRLEVVASLDDPRLDPSAVEALAPWNVASYLTIPLQSNGKVIGIVEIYDTDPRDFAEVTRPARALGEIAAHIMDKALLLQALEQRNRSMREIVTLGARINQTGDPTEMARYVADRVIDVMGATCCEIYKIVRDELRCLVSLDVRPEFEDPQAQTPVDLDRFPSLTRAVKERDLLVFADIDDPRLTEFERELYRTWHFGSELSIPLMIEDRVVGMIDIFDERPRDFAEHLDFARSAAQIVAGAFDNLLLVERLGESNRELRVLADSSLELGASLDFDAVLSSVAARMCRGAGAARCSIYALSGTTLRGLVSTDGSQTDERFPGTTCELAELTVARRAVERGQPAAVDDLRDEPAAGGRACDGGEPGEFRALLELPLLHLGRAVGVASIFDHRPREFEHLDLLRGLGQIAAQALANATVRHVLDANAARLEIINEASLDLASSLDLHHILDAVARRLCSVAEVDDCDVYTLRDRDLSCEVSLIEGVVDDGWVDRTYPLDQWRASRLAVDSKSAVNIATTDDPRLGDDEREEMVAAGRRSALIVPLMVENRVIGIVELFARSRDRGITADEIATVEAICRVASLTIANADLFRDLELRNRESELLNQVAARVGSSLDASTIASSTIDELAALVPFAEACLVTGGQGKPWKVVYASSPDFEELAGSTGAGIPDAFRERLHRERVVTADLDTFDRFPGAPTGPDKMRSLLVIGIWIDDDLGGALALLSPEPDAFATTDRHLLTRVGTQLALSFKNAGLYETIKTMHVSNLKALISALNARDYYAVGHAARVAAYMLLLGRELGWPDGRLQHITEAAFLHDVGRIGVADDVLFKPGRLSDEETAELRNHPVTSAEIVRPLFSDGLVAAVRHHHERWDGHGYPDGLAGIAIPEIARALCIVDSYDAMSFQRPHHAALSYGECLAEMQRCRGHQFDPDMVTAFMRVLDRLDERRSVAREAAETAAARIDPTALVALSSLGDESRPEHGRMATTLREVRDDYPQVRFLTSMAPGSDGWRFVCDPEEDPALHSHLGNPVDRFGAGSTDLSVAAERNVLQLDDFGVWVSGEADVRDERGEQVGLVCADLAPADDWPADLGSNVTGHDGTFSAIVESATARLGRARVDAVTDGLTGLYNQRYFKQRLSEEVTRATEVGGHLTLLFCDLDHFKGYNDRLGHTAGDRALSAMGTVLLRSIRQVDLAARYGGEEFTVILIDTTAAGALDVAERIRAEVAALDLGSPDRGLTVSIGVASFPTDAILTEELIDKADWAMYLAKRQGRDRVLAFQPGMPDPTMRTESS